MSGFTLALARFRHSGVAVVRLSLVLACCCVILGCSTAPPHQWRHLVIPLDTGQGPLEVADAFFLAPDVDLLATDAEMKAFVERYTGALHSGRQRILQLHRALKSPAILNLEYEPQAEGSAQEAFYRGTVNCLSYANLMVAMAREAGLDANYQRVDIRPQWTRMGERIAVRLHVNVAISTREGQKYMADIDPLESRQIVRTHSLTDESAAALHHSNIAMRYLADGNLDMAWSHGVRALYLSPDTAHLWVNLGAVYRKAGQYSAAEHSYQHALMLDASDRSAMNNLMVLYELQGRDVEFAYWRDEMLRWRDANPYYYAWQGDLSAESGDWQQALDFYRNAIKLAPEDSRLLFSTALIYSRLGEYWRASELITQAIEHATIASEAEQYRLELNALRQQHLATL